MNLNGIVGDLRKEFQAKIDAAIAQEVSQLNLEEEQKLALAEQLPGLVLPKLTTKEEARAKELISKLDKQVGQLAELTASIGKTGSEYTDTVRELTALLNGKQHSIHSQHRPTKLTHMLKTIAGILSNDTVNAVAGFRGLPDKATIEGRLNKYNGI